MLEGVSSPNTLSKWEVVQNLKHKVSSDKSQMLCTIVMLRASFTEISNFKTSYFQTVSQTTPISEKSKLSILESQVIAKTILQKEQMLEQWNACLLNGTVENKWTQIQLLTFGSLVSYFTWFFSTNIPLMEMEKRLIWI